ncbi:DNA integrity scanning diadenylate cyclase DisA [uncultured Parolsenella sp.]|uniref:DNA integrity scanning diadenylate cyclase DisA n=1 Tax=uncultured Parolsenella sp. TaxID=2083008 RepID=UPI0025DC122D|nr:DNA integrity scanning diadenylate cyclase DisA [uncultured Parolsenella sp.]
MEQDTTSQVEGRAPSVVPGAVVPAPMNPADPGSTGLFTMPSSQPAPSAVPAPQPAAPAQPERREPTTAERIEQAILTTAPGTAVRRALDMIIAGHLGALICVGDTDAVLAAGNDGFPLNISFTANRLFELSKMDGAIVVDRDLTQILRANFHLNPDPSLPTSETGMRHRTAARMSLLTNALVISVSERRQVVNLYINGKSHQLRAVPEIMTSASQLITTLQTTRQSLDRGLLRLTTLELDNYVTLGDVTGILNYFETLMTAADELDKCIDQLGSEGRTVEMQREQLVGDMEEEYLLLIRDYARDSSEEHAQGIRENLHGTDPANLRSPKCVAKALGYDDLREDSVMVPLGLRTLSRVSVVREGMADKIVDEYGNLRELMDDIEQNPSRLDVIGVKNPSILADSLYRMWGKKE